MNDDLLAVVRFAVDPRTWRGLEILAEKTSKPLDQTIVDALRAYVLPLTGPDVRLEKNRPGLRPGG